MARDFDARFNIFDPITFTWDLAVHEGLRGIQISLRASCSREDLVLMGTGLCMLRLTSQTIEGSKKISA